MNFYKQLCDAVDNAEQSGIECREWAAAKHKSEYTAALCTVAISERYSGVIGCTSLDVLFDYATKIENGDNLEHGIANQPFALVLAAIGAADLWGQIAQTLRLSVVESNGCISILANGAILVSLSAAEWKRRLQMARGVRP